MGSWWWRAGRASTRSSIFTTVAWINCPRCFSSGSTAQRPISRTRYFGARCSPLGLVCWRSESMSPAQAGSCRVLVFRKFKPHSRSLLDLCVSIHSCSTCGRQGKTIHNTWVVMLLDLTGQHCPLGTEGVWKSAEIGWKLCQSLSSIL